MTRRRKRDAQTEKSEGRLSKLFDLKQIRTGTLLLFIGVLLGAALGTGPRPHLPRFNHVPAPVLSRFVPTDWRVASRKDVVLKPGAVRGVVLHIVGPPEPVSGLAPGNVLLLAWDKNARRWSTVFDARRLRRSYPAQDDALFGDNEPDDVKILYLHGASGGSDIAISANLRAGGTPPGQVVIVVRFADSVARVIYSFEGFGSGSISNKSHGQYENLVVTSQFYNGRDSHCCPVRDFSIELKESSSFGDLDLEPVADDRPWTGAYVTNGDSHMLVVSVAPKSPADGVLHPGDEITGIAGVKIGDPNGDYSIEDAVDRHVPGDLLTFEVRRDNQSFRLPLRLASRLDEYRTQARPTVPDFGWYITDTDKGPSVGLKDGESAARNAGIPDGAIVTAIANHATATSDDVFLQLAQASALKPISVSYRDTKGRVSTASVEHFLPIESDPVVPFWDPVVPL